MARSRLPRAKCEKCGRNCARGSDLCRRPGCRPDTYKTRDELLLRLGYKSYAEYLASPLWHEIRERVLSKAEGLCFRCGEPATQVHHSFYTEHNLTRPGRHLRGLFAVCSDCHCAIEFFPGGQKRPLWRSTKVTRREARKAKRE